MRWFSGVWARIGPQPLVRTFFRNQKLVLTRLPSAMTDVIGEIRAELSRLGVTYPSVSRRNEITVTDHRSGNIVLSGFTRGEDFYSPEEATVILDLLRKLPDNSGLERVRSEFA